MGERQREEEEDVWRASVCAGPRMAVFCLIPFREDKKHTVGTTAYI